jgi:hypothetical protein
MREGYVWLNEQPGLGIDVSDEQAARLFQRELLCGEWL